MSKTDFKDLISVLTAMESGKKPVAPLEVSTEYMAQWIAGKVEPYVDDDLVALREKLAKLGVGVKAKNSEKIYELIADAVNTVHSDPSIDDAQNSAIQTSSPTHPISKEKRKQIIDIIDKELDRYTNLIQNDSGTEEARKLFAVTRRRVVNYLIAYGTDPDISKMIAKCPITIIPALEKVYKLNPDRAPGIAWHSDRSLSDTLVAPDQISYTNMYKLMLLKTVYMRKAPEKAKKVEDHVQAIINTLKELPSKVIDYIPDPEDRETQEILKDSMPFP